MSGTRVNGLMTNLVVPEGTNLRSEHLLLIPLSAALARTVTFLSGVKDADSKLYHYDDWWEHDGLHLSRGREEEVISFGVLASLVKTPEALKAGMTGDDNVFVGVAPSDFRWYLRFYCDSDWMLRRSNAEATGRFDITLPSVLVGDYRQQVMGALDLRMEAQESLSYYRSIGMGAYPYSLEEVDKMNEAIRQLKCLMAEISERCYSAGWMERTEFVLWRALTEGPTTWGHGAITDGEIETLKRLSEEAGGWVSWDDETQETFRPMSHWRLIYSKDMTHVHDTEATVHLENSDRCQ